MKHVKCEGIIPSLPCDQQAHGTMDTHGCDLRHLCVGCKLHLDAILEQIFVVADEMECHICGNKITRADWNEWKRYES